jgi:tetratricopeptide (TPR) repeat protein
MKEFFKQNKLVKISILTASILLFAALILWVLSRSSSQQSASTTIPPLPDLEGQPKVLVDYIQTMNQEALKSPSSNEAVGALALAYQSNFFYDEAKICLKRTLELAPGEWKWTYYSALIDEELGDTKATIEKLNRVLEINPEVSQAWFRLGNSYLKTNAYRDAEKAFQKVLALKEYVPHTKAGIELTNTGAFPLKAYASYNLARAEFLENNLNDARTLLEGLIGQNPKFGPAYRLLGEVYQKLGDEKKGAENAVLAGDFESYIPPADPMYDEMILSSRNAAFLIKQFDIAAKSETYQWTLTLMDRLVAIDPNDGEILTKRIKLALDMQILRTADSLMPSFFKICGSDEKKLIDMAKYLVYRAHFEPAVMLLRRAITVNQKAIDAHLLFIDILTEFKQYEMGINYCKEIVPIAPKNAELRTKLARLLIDQGDTKEARQQIAMAQKLSPNDELSFIMLGRISKKEGSTESALDYYQKALIANPRNVNTQLELGDYLLDLRRWVEALNLFQNSIKTSPNDIDLIERFAWTIAVCPLEDLINGEKALELAKRLSLRRKYTKDQEMRCGITLAAAYGRMKQFDQAIGVANKYTGWAKTMKKSSYLHKLEAMTKSFRDKKPYTL